MKGYGPIEVADFGPFRVVQLPDTSGYLSPHIYHWQSAREPNFLHGPFQTVYAAVQDYCKLHKLPVNEYIGSQAAPVITPTDYKNVISVDFIRKQRA